MRHFSVQMSELLLHKLTRHHRGSAVQEISIFGTAPSQTSSMQLATPSCWIFRFISRSIDRYVYVAFIFPLAK